MGLQAQQFEEDTQFPIDDGGVNGERNNSSRLKFETKRFHGRICCKYFSTRPDETVPAHTDWEFQSVVDGRCEGASKTRRPHRSLFASFGIQIQRSLRCKNALEELNHRRVSRHTPPRLL